MLRRSKREGTIEIEAIMRDGPNKMRELKVRMKMTTMTMIGELTSCLKLKSKLSENANVALMRKSERE